MDIPSQDILLTRQHHLADRAGEHYDIRLVVGDVAHSFATKKDMPEIGKTIILYEQPVHDASYALSKEVIIPKGQYGAGKTTLDFVRKANLEKKEDYYTLTTHKGEKYLLKEVPKYDKGAWIFKRLEMKKENKYLEKIAESYGIPMHPKQGKVPKGKHRELYQIEAFSRSSRPTDKRLIINYRNARRWNAD